MESNFITFWCLFITVGSIFFIGLPLTYWINQNSETTKSNWLLTPFIGISFIILFLQNLSYLNLSVQHSTIFLWCTAAIIHFLFLLKHKNQTFSFPTILWIGVIILIIQAIGLLKIGSGNYLGRGWHDQLNYTYIADYLLNFPLHGITSTFTLQPTFLKGEILAHADRIGAPIFQAFLAASTFTNTKMCFEPAILVSTVLIVLSVYQLASKFGLNDKASLLAAFASGVLPSLSQIHLECFYSQALATPFLLIWPKIIVDTLENADWKKIGVAALLLATATSIYTEYLPLLIAITFIACLNKNTFLNKVKVSIVIMFCAVLLNLGFLKTMWALLHRINMNFGLDIYPWANSFSGITRLWLGDWTPKVSSLITLPISLILITLAYLGFAYRTIQKRTNFTLSVLALVLFPFLIHLLGSKHNYQYYKILLSVSPLFPLGIALALQSFYRNSRFLRDSCVLLFILPIISISSTINMCLASTNNDKLIALDRGGAFKLTNPETEEIAAKLSNLSGQNILINWRDSFFNGNYVNGWLSYFAKKNQLWLTNSLVGDNDMQSKIATLTTLPNEFLIITQTFPLQLIKGKDASIAWKNPIYSEWRIQGNNWMLLYPDLTDTNLINNTHLAFDSANNINLKTIAGKSGTLELTLSNLREKFTVETDHHFKRTYTLSKKQNKIKIALIKGVTKVTLHADRNNPHHFELLNVGFY
jgi:hypothetical protein